jgi:hypothetical protein
MLRTSHWLDGLGRRWPPSPPAFDPWDRPGVSPNKILDASHVRSCHNCLNSKRACSVCVVVGSSLCTRGVSVVWVGTQVQILQLYHRSRGIKKKKTNLDFSCARGVQNGLLYVDRHQQLADVTDGYKVALSAGAANSL